MNYNPPEIDDIVFYYADGELMGAVVLDIIIVSEITKPDSVMYILSATEKGMVQRRSDELISKEFCDMVRGL